MIARPLAFLSTAFISAGALAAACSRDTAPTSPGGTDPAAVAAQFNHIGDSVRAAGGTAGDAAPYYGAAGIVAQAPGITTVSIDIDGAATTFSAVAVAVEISRGPLIACPLPPTGSTAAAPYLCPWGIPRVTRTLFAWQRGRPQRIVSFVASADDGPIGTPAPLVMGGTAWGPIGVGTIAPTDSSKSTADAVARPIPAHLEYVDGSGAVWWGKSGTQKNSVKPNGKACPPPPTGTSSAPRPGAIPPSGCQLADFTFWFTGTVSVPPIRLRNNTATGTHTLSLAPASLTGVYLKLAPLVSGPRS